MKNSKTRTLVEGAVMLSLAIALSFITPFQRLLPFGGSITLMSMLPVCVFSIRNGIAKGLSVSFLFAAFQLFQGAVRDGVFGWGLSASMLVGCVMFDYIIPFTVIGFAGIFRKYGMKGWISGSVMVMVMRFASHVMSGVVIFAATGKIWDSLDFVAENKYIYSLVYNGAYMLPEILLTTLGAVVLFRVPQTKRMFAVQEAN